MHGTVKFLIVLLHFSLLCFCTVSKSIQYSAMHKFVGVLEHPQYLLTKLYNNDNSPVFLTSNILER